MFRCNRMREVLFALSLIVPAHAGALELYAGEVVLEEGQGADRTALLVVLDQVLVRLTGRAGEDLAETLGIAERELDRMLLGYQFRRVEVPQPGGGVLTQRRLRAEFDPGAVDRLLAEAGLSSWGRERPDILIWLVSDDGGEVGFVTDDPVLEFALSDAAARYGLSIFRPLGDALDLAEVSVSDVRGGFLESALPATRRYGADAVVMAELRAGPGHWTGRWKWKLVGASEQGFERSAATAHEALEAGLGQIAAALASRFASVRGIGARRQVLGVSGVDGPVHYAELVKYLESLSLVEHIELHSAREDRVEFVLHLSGSGLEEIIALGGSLVFQFRDLPTGALEYRLDW